MQDILHLDELESLAAANLTPTAYDYYRGGADDELTLGENRRAFDRLRLRYRVLVDVSQRSTHLELFGLPLSTPILVAPTAFHAMAHPEGEVATARAAARAGSLMILSSLSNSTLEEVGTACGGRLWFQLYVVTDRGLTREMVARAEAAGARAIVVTVDAPVLGRRRKDVKNLFKLPDHLTLSNLTREPLPPSQSDSALAQYFGAQIDCSLTWKDIEWLRSITSLPVLIKGVVRGDDAALAVDHGASGMVVSNHGGRQLDTSIATIEALAEVVEAVQDRAVVIVDGGVRRGTDVVKALALGARAVLIGRPILWGLALGGEEGAYAVLEHLRLELDRAMALCGTANLSALTKDLVVPRGTWPD